MHVHTGYSFLSVFPSTEVFRVLPVRIEVLYALLCAHLVTYNIKYYSNNISYIYIVACNIM